MAFFAWKCLLTMTNGDAFVAECTPYLLGSSASPDSDHVTSLATTNKHLYEYSLEVASEEE